MPGPRNTKKKPKKPQPKPPTKPQHAQSQQAKFAHGAHAASGVADVGTRKPRTTTLKTTRSASNSCPSTPLVVTPPPPHRRQPTCDTGATAAGDGPGQKTNSKKQTMKPSYALPIVSVALSHSPSFPPAPDHHDHPLTDTILPQGEPAEIDLDVLLRELEMTLRSGADRLHDTPPLESLGGFALDTDDEDEDEGGEGGDEGLWQRKPSLPPNPPQPSSSSSSSSTTGYEAYLPPPYPTSYHSPHPSDHLLLPLPIHDPGTGPRIIANHVPYFLNSYFSQPVSADDALCEEFGQEEVREMLCSVLPEELGLIVWYNKSRLTSRICPTCRRIYRLGDTLRDLTAPLEDPDNPEDPTPLHDLSEKTSHRLRREQELSGLCSPICYFLAAFNAPGAVRQTWGRSVDEICDDDWALLNACTVPPRTHSTHPNHPSNSLFNPDFTPMQTQTQKQDTQGNPYLSLIVKMTRLPDLGLAQMLFPDEEFEGDGEGHGHDWEGEGEGGGGGGEGWEEYVDWERQRHVQGSRCVEETSGRASEDFILRAPAQAQPSAARLGDSPPHVALLTAPRPLPDLPSPRPLPDAPSHHPPPVLDILQHCTPTRSHDQHRRHESPAGAEHGETRDHVTESPMQLVEPAEHSASSSARGPLPPLPIPRNERDGIVVFVHGVKPVEEVLGIAEDTIDDESDALASLPLVHEVNPLLSGAAPVMTTAPDARSAPQEQPVTAEGSMARDSTSPSPLTDEPEPSLSDPSPSSELDVAQDAVGLDVDVPPPGEHTPSARGPLASLPLLAATAGHNDQEGRSVHAQDPRLPQPISTIVGDITAFETHFLPSLPIEPEPASPHSPPELDAEAPQVIPSSTAADHSSSYAEDSLADNGRKTPGLSASLLPLDQARPISRHSSPGPAAIQDPSPGVEDIPSAAKEESPVSAGESTTKGSPAPSSLGQEPTSPMESVIPGSDLTQYDPVVLAHSSPLPREDRMVADESTIHDTLSPPTPPAATEPPLLADESATPGSLSLSSLAEEPTSPIEGIVSGSHLAQHGLAVSAHSSPPSGENLVVADDSTIHDTRSPPSFTNGGELTSLGPSPRLETTQEDGGDSDSEHDSLPAQESSGECEPAAREARVVANATTAHEPSSLAPLADGNETEPPAQQPPAQETTQDHLPSPHHCFPTLGFPAWIRSTPSECDHPAADRPRIPMDIRRPSSGRLHMGRTLSLSASPFNLASLSGLGKGSVSEPIPCANGDAGEVDLDLNDVD